MWRVSRILLLGLLLVCTTQEVVACPCNTSITWSALRALFLATDGFEWRQKRGWMVAESSICDWEGISCTSAAPYLLNIHLGMFGLRRSLPSEIGSLATSVRVWNISDNPAVAGELPASMALWSNMQELYISNTSITGTLRAEFSNWTSLVFLEMTNHKFTGQLPSSFSSWSALEEFHVSRGLLQGTLPPEYSAWRAVKTVYLQDNPSINGTLPPEYGAWSALRQLDIRRLGLTGTLPPEYEGWTRIQWIHMEQTGISGEIPSRYASWVDVAWLRLCCNRLSGTLSPALKNWTKLERLELNDNALTGSIPEEYAIWPLENLLLNNNMRLSGTLSPLFSGWDIVQFVISNNSFSGTLPSSYQSWNKLTVFNISDNRFSGSLPNEYSKWTRIYMFWVSGNHMLNGTLPSSYETWMRITNLLIFETKISGTLPPTWCAWTRIALTREIYLMSNQLSGTLPPEWAMISVISEFDVSGNMLTGTLPPSYKNWTKILGFNVGRNRLQGTIPGDYFLPTAMSLLNIFVVANNRLSGTVPASVSQHWLLVGFIASNNNLTGTLPVTRSVAVLVVQNNSYLSVPRVSGVVLLLSVCFTARCGTPLGASGTAAFACEDSVDTRWSAVDLETRLFQTKPLKDPGSAKYCLGSPSAPMQPPPAARTRRRSAASSVERAAVRAGFVAAVVSATGLQLSASFGARRLQGVGSVAGGPCFETEDWTARGEDMLTADIDVADSPLRIEIGPHVGKAARGAVVGDVLCWVVFAVALLGGVWAARQARRRFSSGSSSCNLRQIDKIPYRAQLFAAATDARMPGLMIVVVPLFFEQIVSNSVLVLHSAGASDVCIGIFGLSGAVAVVVAMTWILGSSSERFRAIPKRRSTKRQRRRSTASEFFEHLTSPCVVWLSRSRQRTERTTSSSMDFVQCFGVLFEGCSSRRHWWSLIELVVSVAVAVLGGLVPNSFGMCVAQKWTAVAISALFLGAAVFLKPMATLLDTISLLFLATAQLVVSVCGGVEVGEDIVAWMSLCLVLVSLMFSIANVVEVVQGVIRWFRRPTELPHEKCFSRDGPEAPAAGHPDGVSADNPNEATRRFKLSSRSVNSNGNSACDRVTHQALTALSDLIACICASRNREQVRFLL